MNLHFAALRCAAVFVLSCFGLAVGSTQAGELRVSSAEPIVVTAGESWKVAKGTRPAPNFPFETFRIFPADGRNAACMVSVLGKDKAEFADPAFLKKLLRGDSRPYVALLD